MNNRISLYTPSDMPATTHQHVAAYFDPPQADYIADRESWSMPTVQQAPLNQVQNNLPIAPGNLIPPATEYIDAASFRKFYSDLYRRPNHSTAPTTPIFKIMGVLSDYSQDPNHDHAFIIFIHNAIAKYLDENGPFRLMGPEDLKSDEDGMQMRVNKLGDKDGESSCHRNHPTQLMNVQTSLPSGKC